MKSYEIIDGEHGALVGVLLYYEKSGTFVIELTDGLDEWTAPLLFTSYVKNRIYTIPRDASLLWVRERVIPAGRQNIQDILANHRLKEYDEMRFLEISGGRCSQDSLYIRKTENLPDFVQERMRTNLRDCLICGGTDVLCFFVDGTLRKTDLSKLGGAYGADKVLKKAALLKSGKVSPGGYSLTFGDAIDIPARTLYEAGEEIPLGMNDFLAFVQNNILDTPQACGLLECSRQNLSYMIKQGKMDTVREDVRGNLYLKSDVLKNLW